MENIFISYASEDKDIAEQIYLALIGAKYNVFFDQTSLPPAGNYNTRLKKGIDQSDLFVFLISPGSVSKGSYALTELKLCREKWKHPENHVVPVLIQKTDFSKIPNYLKAVTFLETEGNIPAEVLNTVTGITKKISINESVTNNEQFPRIKIFGALGVFASIIAILGFFDLPTFKDIKSKIEPEELSIEPKFRGRNVDIGKLNVVLNNPTDKKLCEVKKPLAQVQVKLNSQDLSNEIKIICKDLDHGRNISYTIQSDDGECYANGNGLLGESSSPLINCN